MSLTRLSPRRLRGAFAHFATGVVLVTAWTPERRAVGLTVNSFSSVSLEPPLLLWCLGRESEAYGVLARTPFFGAAILTADQQEIAVWCSTPGQHDLAACPGLTLCEEESPAPRIKGALSAFACRTQARTPAGDHLIILGRVLALDEARAGEPLLYYRSNYRALARRRAASGAK